MNLHYLYLRQAIRRAERRDIKKQHKVEWSKATTTFLVQEVFETFFPEQLDNENDKENKVLYGEKNLLISTSLFISKYICQF